MTEDKPKQLEIHSAFAGALSSKVITVTHINDVDDALSVLCMMSSTHTSDIQSLFEAALSEYETRAGINLIKSELSSKLKTCTCAEDVIAVLQAHARAFQKYRGNRGTMVIRLKQAVNVLYNLSTSTVVGQVIGMIVGWLLCFPEHVTILRFLLV